MLDPIGRGHCALQPPPTFTAVLLVATLSQTCAAEAAAEAQPVRRLPRFGVLAFRRFMFVLLTHTLHRFIHTRHRLTHTLQRFTQGHACVYARRHRHAHTGRLRARRRRRSRSTAAAVRARRSRVNFRPPGSIFRRPSARRSRGRSDVWPSLSCVLSCAEPPFVARAHYVAGGV